MKIISWNVNGIRAVEKKGFVDWILKCGADVVCIQETKANPGQLSPDLLGPGGEYKSFFSSAKRPGYSGTAIYSKTEPDSVEIMGDERFDDEGRVTIAKFNTDKKDKKIAVISAYFPNSQDAGARLDYKLAFCDAMLKKCDALVEEGFNIVLCGDYNIAHKPIDLANPKANEGNAGYLPEERAWMDTFTNAGYVDTFRHFCEEPKQYTWWSYRFHAREKNIGWRIDYQCVNHDFIESVKSSVIMSDVTGSDHCPIMVEVED
ncbi:exodeoxyribonuclease III [Treponema sp.]|uniref:exodeoxyribonuclease III n=1 Tax=Treponema sp. TaxID=166 RepID=UPI00388F8747